MVGSPGAKASRIWRIPLKSTLARRSAAGLQASTCIGIGTVPTESFASVPEPGSQTTTAPFNSTVATSADLAVTKTGPATAIAGTNVTYTLSVTNNEPSDAQAVSLMDTLPAGETFV